jgi:predicted Ser/Thr protein kinase
MTERRPPVPGSPVGSSHEAETVSPPGEPSAVGSPGAGKELPQAAAALRTGTTLGALPAGFGRYRIEKVLGKGGMGAVYLAYDTQLDRHVALKVPTFAQDEGEQRERFFREARAAAVLRHPNLCPVYDIGEHEGVYYLTMAYIEGKPLSDYVGADRPLPPRQAAGIVRQMALALQEAHEHGIIHRDLKPSNVLISPKQEPIITDFGLARRAASQDERLTHSGAVMGTPAYMPPEQVNGDVAAMGPGCDIYALGVILYELLTGRRPFEGPLGSLMAQIIMDPPPPPTRFRPQLDAALEAICLKALAKKPQDRYPSMRAFALALEAWLAGKPVAVSKEPATRAWSPEPLLVEAVPMATLVTPTATRRSSATRRAPKRPERTSRFGPGQWVLVICTFVFLLCVLPVGGIVYLAYQAIHTVADKAGQAGRWIEKLQKEQKKEQERLREERQKEKEQWREMARTWKPPPAGAGSARLFPATVGAYKLRTNDERANIAELNVAQPGWRAVYRGPAGTVELFVYRASELEKEALLRNAQDAVTRPGGVPPVVPIVPGLAEAVGPNVRGSPKGTFLAYDLGPVGGPDGGPYGTFWWQHDWLFLARGFDPHEPGSFLREYLTAISSDRGGRHPGHGKP